jgi:hypothetical protein
LTANDAKEALLRILETNSDHRGERAFYSCPVCTKWHLTSQAQYESKSAVAQYR